MAYKAFITYPACGATIPCSQKLKFSVLFSRYKAYIKLNREIFQPVVILATGSLVLATCCLWNIELPN